MLQNFKKINLQYSIIFFLAIFAGIMISFYNLSILFVLASILLIVTSFKYFNQFLFLLILYTPFQVALNISPEIDLASGRILILYLFMVWTIKSLTEKKFIIKFNLQTLLLGTFLILAIFSILQAWDTERALRKILVFLSIFPLYFIITSLPNKTEIKHNLVFTTINNLNTIENNYVHKIVKILIIGGVLISLIGIIQFFLQFVLGINSIMEFWSKFISPIFYGNAFGAEVLSNPSWLVNVGGVTILRAISLFPDPHMFSFYLGLILPIVLAIVLIDKKNINNNFPTITERNNKEIPKLCMRSVILYLSKLKMKLLQLFKPRKDKVFINNKLIFFAFFIMFLAEIFTLSRGGYIGMISGISILIILSWKYLSTLRKFILGLLFVIFLLVTLFTNQSIINRFISSFDFSEGSNIERIKNWQQGWEIFSDNTITGVGIGNYSIYLYPRIEYRTPVYAHNLYLDIGAEMGIFAVLVWLLLIGITIWQLFKFSKKEGDDFSRSLSLGLIGSLVWFSVHSFFDTAIYSPTILTIFIIIISLSVKLVSNNEH